MTYPTTPPKFDAPAVDSGDAGTRPDVGDGRPDGLDVAGELATPLATELAAAVAEYQHSASIPHLHQRLAAIAGSVPPEALADAVEPFRQLPEVAGPIYERIVAERPNDARALVILANAYWLAGRGPEAVGELASRAI